MLQFLNGPFSFTDYDASLGPNCFLTPVQRCVTDVQYRYSIGESVPGTATPASFDVSPEEGEASMIVRVHSRFVRRGSFILAIVFLTLAAPGCTRAQASAQCTNQGVGNSTTGNVTWTPQFCQEFNDAALTAIDTTVWSFDLGNGTNGWGNNEVEVYCGPPGYAGNDLKCPNSLTTSNNAYIDGSGHLVIQAINNGGAWLSTRMKTQGLENFTYGRIEANIQLPDTTNQGLWPAFWSLGTNITTVNWPTCGEDDFMEVWSPTKGGAGTGGNISTIHTKDTDGAGVATNKHTFTFPAGMANNTALHKYGVIWSANMVQHYVDDPTHPFYIATISDLGAGDLWPFNASSFILLIWPLAVIWVAALPGLLVRRSLIWWTMFASTKRRRPSRPRYCPLLLRSR